MSMKIQHVTRSQPVFHPPVGSKLLGSMGPFSIYRGILVRWTSRYDARVLTGLDELPSHYRNELVAVAVDEDEIEVVWADGVRCGTTTVVVEGDEWMVLQEWDARTGAPCA